MAKRKSENIMAYVHAVSPQKKSKSFHLRIQTNDVENSTSKVMCFDGSMREKILDAKLSGEAVKFKNIIKSDNEDNKFYADYVINSATTLESVDPINVPFKRMEQQVSDISLADTLPVGELISVKAMFEMKHAAGKNVKMGNRQREVLNQCHIFNADGSIELTLWDEWIPFFRRLVAGESTYFHFINLLVRGFGDGISLSTCSDTEVLPLIDEMPDVEPLNFSSDVEELIISEIVAVHSVNFGYLCPTCGSEITIKTQDEVILNCSSCKTHRKVANARKVFSALVEISQLGKDLYKLDINQFFPDEEQVSFQTDKDIIIARILSVSDANFMVNKRKKIITKVD